MYFTSITVLELCKNCDPEMWLELIHDYTKEKTLIQVKDVIKKSDDWLGMEIVGKITNYLTYVIDDKTLNQLIPVLTVHYY